MQPAQHTDGLRPTLRSGWLKEDTLCQEMCKVASCLPDVTDDFAAEALHVGVMASHQSLWR
jgi:hypothetical protein